MAQPKAYQVFGMTLQGNVRTTIEVKKAHLTLPVAYSTTYIIRADNRTVGEIRPTGAKEWHLHIRGIYWRHGKPNLFGGTGVEAFRTHALAVNMAVCVIRGVYEQ